MSVVAFYEHHYIFVFFFFSGFFKHFFSFISYLFVVESEYPRVLFVESLP